MEIVVIWQGFGRFQRQSKGMQHREKRLRPRDAGQRQQAAAPQAVQADPAAVGALGVVGQIATGHETGDAGATFDGLKSVQHNVHVARPGFAQRTRWQQQAVAGAALVKHADLDIPLQRKMLQSVITHDDVRARMARQQCPCGIDAARGHEDRRACGPTYQQRFIAGDPGIRFGQDLEAIIAVAAKPSGDQPRSPPTGLQMPKNGHDRGRLAGAASHDVTDDDDWHARVMGSKNACAVAGATDGDQAAQEQRKWP